MSTSNSQTDHNSGTKDENILLNDHFTTVLNFKRAQKEMGESDIEKISDRLHKFHEAKLANKHYHYNDNCIKKSSNTEVTILQPDGKEYSCILWCVNHYLGLNRHPHVIERTKAALDEYGTGSGTSAMSGGLSELHFALKKRLAKMIEKEAVVLYPTGYTANLGAISALTVHNDLILSDKECHASIVDGCRLSGKKIITFNHNDVHDLEQKLSEHAKNYTNVFVIVESVYSMSGDISPLKEIVALKKKYKFYLYVDEAHSLGFYGDKGKGYCYQLGVTDQVDFIMSTLSKATASIGGFVATSAKFAKILRYAANSYIFQASIPPANVATVLACLDIIETNPDLMKRLHDNASYFRKQLHEVGFDTRDSKSPIIPVYVKDLDILNQMSRRFIEEGIYSIPVIYPAVPKEDMRFRFILTAVHTKAHIDHTVNVLKKLGKEYGLI